MKLKIIENESEQHIWKYTKYIEPFHFHVSYSLL